MKTNGTETQWARQRGVTLIELMITVVVLAVLASLALPSYRQYAMRAHRTEAKNALLQLQADQERFYLENDQYTTNPANLQSFSNAKSEHGVYTLSINAPNPAQGYTATAQPTAGGGSNGVDQTQDSHCASFSITSDGVRSATNADCW